MSRNFLQCIEIKINSKNWLQVQGGLVVMFVDVTIDVVLKFNIMDLGNESYYSWLDLICLLF